MRYLSLFISCLLLFAISSCKKPKNDRPIILNGTYKGTFERTSYDKEQSEVILKFSADGTYQGSSNQPKYPALCNSGGNYSISRKKVTFRSMCIWTAEFDWTLILEGDYQIEQDGDTVRISKSHGGGTKDIYMLVKQ
jgi:hypothetical protein